MKVVEWEMEFGMDVERGGGMVAEEEGELARDKRFVRRGWMRVMGFKRERVRI